MGAQSRKIRGCMLWLVGLIRGDGYIDNRHVEIYNSSACILRNAVKVLRTLKIPVNRIKVDIYTQKASNSTVQRWVEELNLPPQNFKLRNITSPWKPRTEKVRIRIASKKLAETLHRLLKNAKNSKFYIKGLFDAEASVDIKGYVEFKQAASESGIKLVKDVNHALRRIGIEVTEPKIKKDKRNKKKDIYFYVKDLEKFRDLIGFVDETKKQKLNILIEVKKNYKKPVKKEIKKPKHKSLWDVIFELKLPYHVIRRLASSYSTKTARRADRFAKTR